MIIFLKNYWIRDNLYKFTYFREHTVYSIEQPSTKTDLTTPLVMDTSGLWLRRNELTNNLLCGLIPTLSLDSGDLVEEEYYHNIIKPCLINRVPSCNTAEVSTSLLLTLC